MNYNELEKDESLQDHKRSVKKKKKSIISTFFTTLILVCVEIAILLCLPTRKILDYMEQNNFGAYIIYAICFALAIWLIYTIYHCIHEKEITGRNIVSICTSLGILAVIGLTNGSILETMYRLSTGLSIICGVVAVVFAAIGICRNQQNKQVSVALNIAIIVTVTLCVILLGVALAYSRVPSVNRKTVGEAETILLEKGFRVSLDNNEKINNENRLLLVDEQIPDPNTIHCKFIPVILNVEEPTPIPDPPTPSPTTSDSPEPDNPTPPPIIPDPVEPDTPTPPTIPVPTIPKYTEIFKEKNTALEEVSGRHLAHFGPGDDYPEAYGYETNKCSSIKVYYRINGWVLTSLYYNSVNQRRWVYLPEGSIDSPVRKDMKPLYEDISSIKGKVKKSTASYWAPIDESKQQHDTYVLNKGDLVDIYFMDEEGEFVFAEFKVDKTDGKNGKARMWIPLDCIDFD